MEFDVVAVKKNGMVETTLYVYREGNLCGEVIFETFKPMDNNVLEEYVKTLTKIAEKRDARNKKRV